MSKGEAQKTIDPRFKPYPSYKRSDVEWLGEIPSHWEVRRLRSTITGCQNGVWGDEPDGVHDVACVRVADFDRVSFRVEMEDPTLRSIQPEWLSSRGLRAGDLLLEKSGGGENQPVGAVVLYDHTIPAVCSNFIARVTVADGYNSRFLTYLHAAMYALRINTRHIKQSTGIQNLDSSSYLTEATGLPPEPEQRAITVFLDKETSRIDALVAEKERLIELLQEKRTTLITSVVTKGLNPKVPLKNSSVEWLGQIPAHWAVKRVKWAAKMESGHTPDKKVEDYWTNCDIPWISLNDTGYLKNHDYISDTAYQVNSLGLANSSARLLPPRAVVFSRDATIGLCAITTCPMAVSQHFIAWLCRSELLPEYLLYVFRSMTQELERLTMGATIMTIGMTDVRTLVTPIPPLLEQDQIVAHIRVEVAKLDTLTAKVIHGIDHLKEYRTALISAAVTGKIDVRGRFYEP